MVIEKIVNVMRASANLARHLIVSLQLAARNRSAARDGIKYRAKLILARRERFEHAIIGERRIIGAERQSRAVNGARRRRQTYRSCCDVIARLVFALSIGDRFQLQIAAASRLITEAANAYSAFADDHAAGRGRGIFG